MDVAFVDAVEQARLVRSGEVSPVELVDTYLRRIDKLDDTVNAFVTVDGDRALDAARAAEKALAGDHDSLPAFHGVPISIKDLNLTADLRTTFCTKSYADHVPAIDTSTVRRIKGAGFIVLGKTNTPEFGTIPMTESDVGGICRNPWNPEVTPGGSSGGAAAALAAGMCAVSQGSDGGGSIRIPASCCGLFGLKPQRGRVSRAPLGGDGMLGFSTDGPIARSVRDAAALLDVMEGYETGDPSWAPPPLRPFSDDVGADPGRLKVAFTLTPPLEVFVHPECVAAAEAARDLLSDLGHEVTEATPPWQRDDLYISFVRIWQTLAAHTPVEDVSQMEPVNQALTRSALETNSLEYVRAANALQAQARTIVAFWKDYDLVLTPTLALPPVPVGWILQEETDGWMQFAKCSQFVPFTPVVNMTGQPAVSLPLHWSDDGLPIGVQLIGRPADEATLIRVSAQLERAQPWAHRRPPVS